MSQLRERLARIRHEKRNRGPKKRPEKQGGRRGELRHSKCGPNGEVREHPLVEGLEWLHRFGVALIIQGVAFNSRVSAEHWEKDGCLSLYLQRVVNGAPEGPIRMVGGRVVALNPEAAEGGMWERFRVPVGAVNAMDTKWVLRAIMRQDKADLVLASNPHLRAMHGLVRG